MLTVGPGLRHRPLSREELVNNRQRGLEKVKSSFVLGVWEAETAIGERHVEDELGMRSSDGSACNHIQPVAEIRSESCGPLVHGGSGAKPEKVNAPRREVDSEDVERNMESLGVGPVVKNEGSKGTESLLKCFSMFSKKGLRVVVSAPGTVGQRVLVVSLVQGESTNAKAIFATLEVRAGFL